MFTHDINNPAPGIFLMTRELLNRLF